MFNLFMTVLILIFLLVAYLYYKITVSYKEAFQESDDKFIVNGIDISNLDVNNIDINSINKNPIDVTVTPEDIRNIESTAKSTDGKTDVISNVNTQCELYKKQVDTLSEKLDEYRFKGYFDDLRRTYASIETVSNKMNTIGCK